MYSFGRGDVCVIVLFNVCDLLIFMFIDYVFVWQREFYNRDMRLDRGDRDRIIGGKREWNFDWFLLGVFYYRVFGGLYFVNGSFGFQIKC